ncbi:hypothetical protein EDC04DRAFT_929309 [Pisolithus marmoratus]|nr:hypothetical protein EDC04DRAFT_929309 [Pisolithus marmoratus]
MTSVQVIQLSLPSALVVVVEQTRPPPPPRVLIGLGGRNPVSIRPHARSRSRRIQCSPLSQQPAHSTVHCVFICVTRCPSCIGPTTMPVTFSSYTTHDTSFKALPLATSVQSPYRLFGLSLIVMLINRRPTSRLYVSFLALVEESLLCMTCASVSHCTLHLPPCAHALFISLAVRASRQIPASNFVPLHGVLPRGRSSQLPSYPSLPSGRFAVILNMISCFAR